MYCKNCGVRLNPADQQCPSCGYTKGPLAGGNGFWDICSSDYHEPDESLKSSEWESAEWEPDNMEVSKQSEGKTDTSASRLPASIIIGVVLALVISLAGIWQKNAHLQKENELLEERAAIGLRAAEENSRLQKTIDKLELELRDLREGKEPGSEIDETRQDSAAAHIEEESDGGGAEVAPENEPGQLK